MRRLIIALAALFAVLPVSFAQMTVTAGSAEISVEVKRAIAQGNEVAIDIFVTCFTASWGGLDFGYFQKIYDDEGNLYDRNSVQVVGDGGGNFVNLEKDIPRKFRVVVKEVDEYASQFLLGRLKYMARKPDGGSIKESEITIKNLPIERP